MSRRRAAGPGVPLGCLMALALLLLGCAEETSRGMDSGPRDRGSGSEAAVVDGLRPVADHGSGLDTATDHGPGVDLSVHQEGGTLPVDGPPSPTDAAPAIPDQGVPLLDQKVTPPAGEFKLFDKDNLQFTVGDNGFMPLIKPGDALPLGNWSSPTDYYDGEFQIRYVINSPPSQAAGKLQTCIWTMGNEDGDGKNYFPESCSSQVAHTGVGTYFNTSLVPSKWWKLNGVPLVFAHPERFLIRVVLRGTSGCNVTTYNVANACWDQWPSFKDMKLRVTIVMVPKGGSFSGWASYP